MSLLLQLAANGIAVGAQLAPLAYGFGLIYFVCGVLHIAHGGVLLLAAAAIYAMATILGWPWIVASVVALPLAFLVGIAFEVFAYRPLRRARRGGISLFIVSLGVLLLITNLLPLWLGAAPIYLPGGVVGDAVLLLDGNLAISVVLLAGVPVALGFLLLVEVWLRLSRDGRAIRAVIDSKDAAAIVGIPVERSYLLALGVGSALTVPAAAIQLLVAGSDSQAGHTLVFTALCAVLIGGIGSLRGTIAGSFFVGIISHVGVFVLPSNFADAITFAALLVFIAVRPKGMFGGHRATVT